jgi:hypothetical protein
MDQYILCELKCFKYNAGAAELRIYEFLITYILCDFKKNDVNYHPIFVPAGFKFIG